MHRYRYAAYFRSNRALEADTVAGSAICTAMLAAIVVTGDLL